jgi:uncharacterized protein (DUF1697 family)
LSLYAAFLRGMNVGGHRLTNAELQRHFHALGYDDVATFRASGNVVFAGGRRAAATVREAIEKGLRERLGYEVATFIRSAEQLRAIAEAQPFDAEAVAASRGKLQVAMLRGAASAKAKRELGAAAGEDDLLAWGECELFWLPSGGLMESQLEMKVIEQVLGPMTMRTKNTVEQIVARYLDD